MDSKANSKAKMCPEVTKGLGEKFPTKEESPKVVVLYSQCLCEVLLKVIPPKPKESFRELTTKSIREQVQTSRPRSAEKNVMESSAKNYNPHNLRGMVDVRLNKRSLYEYQDRYKMPQFQPKRRNQLAPLRYEDITEDP